MAAPYPKTRAAGVPESMGSAPAPLHPRTCTAPAPTPHPRTPQAQAQAARAPKSGSQGGTPSRDSCTHIRHCATQWRCTKCTALLYKTQRRELLPPKTHALRPAVNRIELQWCGSCSTTLPRRGRAKASRPALSKQHPLATTAVLLPHVPAHHASPLRCSDKKRNGERLTMHLRVRVTPCPRPCHPHVVLGPLSLAFAPAPAPSHPLLPSVPERTRLFLNLPPTRFPVPHSRNLVV
ncbi:hypothetical protein B0H13DRAFT_366368 [Mycena leptocephala]|nr:hypothetical protein B0H13DRAFT_366368 [Mycena leptocephala]